MNEFPTLGADLISETVEAVRALDRSAAQRRSGGRA